MTTFCRFRSSTASWPVTFRKWARRYCRHQWETDKGAALARDLGLDLFSKRGTFMMPSIDEKQAVTKALEIAKGPVVIADMWDNPGGGTAGDATVVLEELLARGVENVAIGLIWDPIAVQICMAAGEGRGNSATLRRQIRARYRQSCGWHREGGEAQAQCRNEIRRQHRALRRCGAYPLPRHRHHPRQRARAELRSSLFTALGVDPLAKRILVIKSTNHFYAAFSKIASEILYCSAGTPYPNNPATNPYRRVRRDIWPIMADPHENEAA